jgi:HK97 family phage portal protein
MGLLEEMAETRRARSRRTELDWPVGKGALLGMEEQTGHNDTRFSPEEYGDYLATSNDVYAAVSLRARLMSSLRPRFYVGGESADRTEITTGPAVDLLRYVNPFWTWERLQRMDEMSMGVWGETAWAVERNARTPAELWWLKPSRLRPVPHERKYLSGFLYEAATGELIPFEPDEVVWFRYPNPIDEFSALSPLAAARLAADTGKDMMRANRELFKHGLMAGGMVVPDTDKVTFSPEQAAELEQLLEDRFKGVNRAHRWSVLRYEAQFRGMNVTPKDAEFVLGLGLTLKQVANAYGIPTPLLNELEHATLANAREFQTILWAHSLKPDAQLRAGDIREQYLPLFKRRPGPPAAPDWVEFDFSGVPALNESESATWDRERQAIESGAMTINEWRKRKGMPPVKWGDVYWAPVNKAPVKDGKPPKPSTPPPQDGGNEPAPQGGKAPAGDGEPPSPPPPAGQNSDDARALLLDAFRLNGHRTPSGAPNA